MSRDIYRCVAAKLHFSDGSALGVRKSFGVPHLSCDFAAREQRFSSPMLPLEPPFEALPPDPQEAPDLHGREAPVRLGKPVDKPDRRSKPVGGLAGRNP